MNDIAKAMWDIATQYLDAAQDNESINETICYTGIAECALKMATFAVNNPALVMGIDEMKPPMPTANSPVPQQPMNGPKFWGAPTP